MSSRMNWKKANTGRKRRYCIKNEAKFMKNDSAAKWFKRNSKKRRAKVRDPKYSRAAPLKIKGQAPKNTVVMGTNGPPCHRCRRPTEIRQHKEVGQKELEKSFYYWRWFKCVNPDCRTTEIMREEFKVFPTKPSSVSEVER